MIDDNFSWNRLVLIKLRQKGREDGFQILILHMPWETCVIPVILSPAKEKDLNARHALPVYHGNYIGVLNAADVDILRGLQGGESLDPVAVFGGQFKMFLLAGFQHLPGKPVLNRPALPV